MFKWIKRLLAVVATLIILVIATIIALPFIVNPNDLREPLTTIAEEQGIQLDIKGDLAWQFFPTFGISVGQLSIAAPATPTEKLLQLDSASFAVSIPPLLNRQIEVKEVVLDGAEFVYWLDDNGNSNWDVLLKNSSSQESSETPATQTDTGTGSPTSLAINALRINDARLNYRDTNTQLTAALSINTENVNLNSQPFPIVIELSVTESNVAPDLELALNGNISVDEKISQLQTQDWKLQINAGDASLKGSFDSQVQLEPLKATGSVDLNIDNIKGLLAALAIELPPMQDPQALEKIQLATGFNTDGSTHRLADLKLTLDDSILTGRADISTADRFKVAAALTIDQINVDNYLAPASTAADTSATPATGAQPVAAADTELPLAALRDNDADLQLDIGTLVVSGLTVSDARLKVTGDRGEWKIAPLSGKFYDSDINLTATLNARNNRQPATVAVNATLDGLSTQALLTTLAGVNFLSGKVNAKVVASSSGNTTNQLQEKLRAAVNLNSSLLSVAGFNAEQKYCEMADSVEQTDTTTEPRQWPQRTDIRNLKGDINIDGSNIVLNGFGASLNNMSLQLTGGMNLDSQQYGVRMPLTLQASQTSDTGCKIDSKFLVQRPVDIIACNGSLAGTDGGVQCGLDRQAVAQLAKDAVSYNVQKRVDEKKEDVREKVRNRLRDALGR